MNIVDSHDTARILTDLGGKRQSLEPVVLYQMTWPGAPTIYYGDEAGLQGYTDPDDRRTFPWDHQDTSLEAYYSRAIHLRLRYGALSEGSVVPLLALDKQRVIAYLRQRGKQKIVVVLNDSNASQTITIQVPQIANGTRLSDLLSGSRDVTSVRNGALKVTVPKLGGRVLG
jgi:glycosidase